MAIFEDVNGKPQVVSTEGRATSESWSHDSAGKHTDNRFSTTQSVSNDGHGHSTETFTKVTEVTTHDAKTHQVHTDLVSQSVTKELAAGQRAVDLSKVLDEHSDGSTIPGLTYQNEHRQSTATESGRQISEQHEVIAWDKVGNRESYGGGSMSGGISEMGSVGHSSAGSTNGHALSGAVGFSEGHSHTSVSVNQQHSAGYMEGSTAEAHLGGSSGSIAHGSSHSEGLSAHVSDSLVNHLVSRGYSAHEAQQTVQGVSHTLGQEVNGHSMGSAGSVEFHKHGDVAVSLSNENTASNGNTISVAMDSLKAVHESGMSQNLDAVQASRSAQPAPQAVAELSR